MDSIVRQEEEALERRSSSERLADGIRGVYRKASFRSASPSALDCVAASKQWQHLQLRRKRKDKNTVPPPHNRTSLGLK